MLSTRLSAQRVKEQEGKGRPPTGWKSKTFPLSGRPLPDLDTGEGGSLCSALASYPLSSDPRSTLDIKELKVQM